LFTFLRSRGVPHAALFAAMPAALSWPFLVRMAMPRTQSLSLILLTVASSMLVERRWRGLAVVAFLFMWTYHVALVLVPLALLWSGVMFLRGERSWPVLLAGPGAAAMGLFLGLLVHPQSPGTFRFVWVHVVQKVRNHQRLPVGGEWVDGGVSTLLSVGGPSLLLLALAFALLAGRRRAPERDTTLLLTLAVGAHLALLGGSKAIEYGAPFAALALGLVMRDVALALPRPALHVAQAAMLGLGTLTAAATAHRVQVTEPPPHRAEPAMAWLRAHAAPGDVVYHWDWGDLPELVFHGPEFRYIVGLDPHFLALAHPDLWELYDRIARGWGRNPSKPIRERFGAHWAVLLLPWPGARESLATDPALVVRFEDGGAVVFEVLAQPPGS
jgi:hypothetical protein